MQVCPSTDYITSASIRCSCSGSNSASTATSCIPDVYDAPELYRPGRQQFNVGSTVVTARPPANRFINKQPDYLKQKYHAYRSIWNCNKFKLNEGRSNEQPDVKTVQWKFWPPPVVPVPKGLKIPVQYKQEIATPPPDCSTPPKPELQVEKYYVAGEDEVEEFTVNLIKAEPQEELPWNCLCGVLNSYESQTFAVSPSQVLFLGTEIGETYTMTLKVKNNGNIPRRVGVINPKSNLIDIDWGVGIGETALIAPGLSNRIIVKFRPKSVETLQDTITILIHDDGVIIIPVIAEHLPPPILEMDQWDVGCSIIANSSMHTFDVINHGGEGRFWILSEEEFTNEYIELTYEDQSARGIEISDMITEMEELNKIEDRELSMDEKTRLEKLQEFISQNVLGTANEIRVEPFVISPSSFHLQKNQVVTIQIQYLPTTANYHIRKLVLLCDNGEVRWIAVKGVGIDPKKSPLVDIQGKWMAPAFDLPTDLNTRLSLDCGDLLAGEKNFQCLTIKNNSCMPLYFFWTVRHLRLFDGSLVTDTDSHEMEIKREGLTTVHWKDYSDCLDESQAKLSTPIKIYPAQNILQSHQVLDCVVSVQAPPAEGYYTSILSLFVQQLNERSESILTPHLLKFSSEFENNDPITLESLTQTLPTRDKEKQEKSKLPMDKEQDIPVSVAPKPIDVENELGDIPSTQSRTNSTKLERGDQVEIDLFSDDETNSFHFEKVAPIISPWNTSCSPSQGTKSLPDDTQTQFPFFHIKPNKEDPPYDLKLVRLAVLESNDNTNERNHAPQLVDGQNNEEAIANSMGYSNSPKQLTKIVRIPFNFKTKKVLRSNSRPSTIRFSSAAGSRYFSSEDGSSREAFSSSNRSTVTWTTWTDVIEEGGEDYDLFQDPNFLTDVSSRASNKTVDTAIAHALAKEGCILAQQYKMAKSWLDASSTLKPVEEIEIWMRTTPLQCWFFPPHISGFGSYANKVARTIEFFNGSAYPVELSVHHFVSPVGTITCSPYEVNILPSRSTALRFTLDFRTHGNHEGKVKGTIKLPFATVSCWIPFRLQSQGPQLCIVTPFINFGQVLLGTEKSKTIVLKNNGLLRTKWRARIPPINLRDDNLNEMSLPNSKINNEKLVRVWPEWGTIEANETVAIQIYLSAEYSCSLSAACEITNEENVNEVNYVTILAHVQGAQVILRDTSLLLEDAYVSIPNYSVRAFLQNLTSFFTPFKWQLPVGSQQDMCSVVVSPGEGILPPKGTVICEFEFFCDYSLVVTNLFVPCCVGGMRELLIAKVEGTVFGACIKIVIPITKFYRVREEDLPWECHDELWPRICGIPEDEEMDGEDKFYTSAINLKYCEARKEYRTTAPPPSVTGGDEDEQITAKETKKRQSKTEAVKEQKTESKRDDLKPSKSKVPSSKGGKPKKGKKEVKEKKRRRSRKSITFTSQSDNEFERTHQVKTKSSGSSSLNISVSSKSQGRHAEEPDGATENKDGSVHSVKGKSAVSFQYGSDAEIKSKNDSSSSLAIPEDDSRPDTALSSQGRQIYFQIRKRDQRSVVTFKILNESPVNTAFCFKICNHPFPEETEEITEQPEFVILDDDFFQQMSSLYTKTRAPDAPEDIDSVLQGKRGGFFKVSPIDGYLDAKQSVEVAVEFRANLSGIYEDSLECYFRGIENPYIIRLEALAIFCDNKISPPPSPSTKTTC